MTTYSFKDLSGAFSHPDVGAYTFGGKQGLGQIVVGMSMEQTAHDVSADGSVMVSAISGDNGHVTVEAQQTSNLHKFLLNWYNTVKTAKDNGDPTNWAAAALTLRSLSDGTSHIVTGVSPSKNPDKPYAAQGQKVTWNLMAADIQSVAA